MKKTILFVLSFLFVIFSVQAQTFKQLKGKVVDDSTNAFLPDATVMIAAKDFKKTVKADATGVFTAQVPSNLTSFQITVTYSGYVSKTFSSDGSVTTYKVKRDVSDIGDVVVIGYQTVKRKDIQASVASVSAKDLKDVPLNSVGEALNGRLAGVTANVSEGSPDAEIRVRVRGGMSITGDNNPLYIVDGVQVENGLNSVVLQDIQSIDVLKDAAATAIYGARGANGVVIITTKSGKKGKLKVTYNGFVGIKVLPQSLKVMSPYDFVVYGWERSQASQDTTFLKTYGTYWDTLNVYKNYEFVDWQKEVMGNTGVTQTHNIGFSGGTNKTNYNFSYTFNNEKAIVQNSNFKRHQLNFKADHKISKKLKFQTSIRYSNQNVLGIGISEDGSSSLSRLRNAVKYRPFLFPEEDLEDDDPATPTTVSNNLALNNPFKLANSEYNRKSTNQMNVSGALTYTINKNWTLKTTIGYDARDIINRKFYDSGSSFSKNFGGRMPAIFLDTTKTKTLTNSNTLSYTLKSSRNIHSFSAVVGQETYTLNTTTSSLGYSKLPNWIDKNVAFDNYSIGTIYGQRTYYESKSTLLSFFTQLSYDYKKKYYFTFNYRADGSSKFAPEKRWGYFPSGSFAWRLKNEEFIKGIDWINELKLRVGYGSVGNNRIADYLYLTTFRNDQYQYGIGGNAVSGYSEVSLVNRNLVWESLVNQNIGLDFTILKGKLDVSIDYYVNNSNHLLLNVPVASTYGFATQQQNVGSTQNKGWEFQINATPIKEKDFSYSIGLNMSFNRNKVKELGLGQSQIAASGGWGVSGLISEYLTKVGEPVGSIYGWVNDGFYTVDDFNYNSTTQQYTLKPGVPRTFSPSATISTIGILEQPGTMKLKDLNGDGYINDLDRTVIGNPTPKFTGGFTNNFVVKNWDLSVFFNFAFDYNVLNANKIEFTNAYIARSNMLEIMKDRWKTIDGNGARVQWVSGNNVFGVAPERLAEINANAQIWQPINSGNASFLPNSWAVEDGTFIRLNNITLGYNFPVKTLIKLNKLYITKLRAYVTANNLAMFTYYSGYDPEVSVRKSPLTPNLDYSAYPRSRSFVAGVNVSF